VLLDYDVFVELRVERVEHCDDHPRHLKRYVHLSRIDDPKDFLDSHHEFLDLGLAQESGNLIKHTFGIFDI
jgi:hypothetical protein